MSEKHHLVIGIDLGTTYSAVSVYNRFEEETEIIPNPESVDSQSRLKPETTPSVVSLDPQTRNVIVGWPAKKNLADTANTVIEIKREMGEVFSQETLQKFHAGNKFRAKEGGENGFEGDPVKVMFCDDWYLPQEISAFTLMKMKAVAEAHIGETIRDAVITVPAYFKEKQKKATEEAAFLAGLYPRQIIGEPTAAAICYGVDRLESDRKVYLVYDLGGGTFDVSIIRVEESQIAVLSTSGDPRLGGGDFDDAIVDWAVEELRNNFQLDAAAEPEKIARIKAHAEQAKKDLSSLNSATMTFIDVWPQQPPSLELTREKFEELIDPLLAKSITYVDAALNQAESQTGLRRDDLDAILLVGGSTKIPRVKTLLLEYFEQDESFVSSGLNPDEVVARGAAMVAVKFAPSAGEFDISKRPDNTLINTDMDDEIDVSLITEHSLGVGVQNNLVRRLIDQGTGIPVSLREGGFTNAGPTDHVDVPVYQGEGEYTYQCTLIGTLRIGPMEPKPENTHQFEVTFSLDDNGLLSMTVHHLNEGKNYQAQFDQKTGVGGTDALMARRQKLLKMCGSGNASVQPAMGGTAQPPTGAAVPAPTGAAVPAPTGAAVPAPTGASLPDPGLPQQPPVQDVKAPVQPAPAPVQPPAQPDPVAPQPVAAQPSPSPVGAAQPAPVATPVAAPIPSPDEIIEPIAEVPAEFKSLVRRSHKRLLNDGPAELREVFNGFVTLLNNGASDEEIEDAGDALADVYHDCR